ncbi:limonene-1,2-epoxide hydrolase family protein [Rhodococcus opacus]|uniref:Limonene-1,2-epoxide hydrolase n=1 Tax=Rhodococcus opacus TaxID=37919 RepID=A0A076EHQ7_RHOOP|nr:limonene-1,2-epoxide hydrolase family protein [Rhodococcus opacus]AII05730.1 limonene-1,2-epoxide hydrolase [Rhodococcus opacus]
MSATPTEIAETFIAHWNANRVEEALAMLSDDVLYDNVPYPDITGRHNVRKFHLDFGMGTDFRADWKIVNIAAVGNVVLNERVDDFHHSSGSVISLPVMGTITVEDGTITVWRDYFDPAEIKRQLAEIKR